MIFRFDADKKFLSITDCTELELSQLRLSLKKRITNWRFHPLVKSKKWDGYIDFMTKFNKIPAGLWNELYEIGEHYNINIEIENLDDFLMYPIDEEHFKNWVKEFYEDKPDFKPRDYQIESCIQIIKYNRSISDIATAAGKTLITFLVNTYLLQFYEMKRFLIIVPNISLIEQTVEKFEIYSDNNEHKKMNKKWNSQMILTGASKVLKPETNLVVGTYQSLCKMPPEFFAEFDCVCVDESHSAQVQSVQTIFKMLGHVHFRYGLSGTTKVQTKTYNQTAESYTIQSLLGPVVNRIKSKYLFEKGHTTPVSIKVMILSYLNEEERDKLKNIKKSAQQTKDNDNFTKSDLALKLLNLEKQIAITNTSRNKYIIDLVSQVKNNSLLLFGNIKDSYGKDIYNQLVDKFFYNDKYQVFYVDGSTPMNNRTYINEQASRTDIITIIVASFGVFSTGIDIPNIFNIFLLESFKSEVIVKQTLGRGMRLFDQKKVVLIFDFVDDFRCEGFDNYLYKHGKERMSLYEEECFKYSVMVKKLNYVEQKKLF